LVRYHGLLLAPANLETISHPLAFARGGKFSKELVLQNNFPLVAMHPYQPRQGRFFRQIAADSKKLRQGVVSIFPEAGRNRYPELSRLRQFGRGAAVLAYETHAIVVPAAMRGPENILPIGHGPVTSPGYTELVGIWEINA